MRKFRVQASLSLVSCFHHSNAACQAQLSASPLDISMELESLLYGLPVANRFVETKWLGWEGGMKSSGHVEKSSNITPYFFCHILLLRGNSFSLTYTKWRRMRLHLWQIGFLSHHEQIVNRFSVHSLWNSSCKWKITGQDLILLVGLHSYMDAEPCCEYFCSKTDRTLWLQQQQQAECQQLQFPYSSVPRYDSEKVKWH